MYKAIIFDLDNTLLNYSLSELESMKRTVRDHQLLEDDAQWELFWESYREHNGRHWLDFVNGRGPHTTIEEVLISSFRDTLNTDESQHVRLSSTYWDYFCSICYFEDGAEEVLHSLRSQFRLGMISNGIGEAQRKRLAAGRIYDFFDSIIVSDEVGVRKPRKEIFDCSLHELKLTSREVLFIGDSLSDDYQGAKNAGIDFCFYNRDGMKIANDIKPKYIVRSLKELVQVVGLGAEIRSVI